MYAACSWPKPSQYQADPKTAELVMSQRDANCCHVATHKHSLTFPVVGVCARSFPSGLERARANSPCKNKYWISTISAQCLQLTV